MSERMEAEFTIPTGGAAVAATNDAGGPTTVTIPAGDYFVSELVEEFETRLNATLPPLSGAWAVGISTTTGLVTISCSVAFSITWTSTTLRDTFGFTGNLAGSPAATGERQAELIWFPGCNFLAETDPKQAPAGDDNVASVGPTGRVYFLGSDTEFFCHRQCKWPAVSRDRVWASEVSTVNSDWETFYRDSQLAEHAWCARGARVRIYWINAGVHTELGNGLVDAWRMPMCAKLSDLRVWKDTGWTGLVEILLGDLYSDG